MIRVVVQDERGMTIGDPVDLPTDILPSETDAQFVCLRFIDPYGDTVFNRIQSEYLAADLRLLNNRILDQDDSVLVEATMALVKLCMSEPHRYIKFIGD